MLRPDTLALTALLALLTSLGPLSTDMYLPSLPEIGRVFGATPADVQLTLSAFLVGFALAQIVYGPLSDVHGRKPVLIAALGLYVAGSVACALATSVEMLVAARVVQAIGAAGPIVLARSVVRDLYAGPRAGAELSRMGTIMGLVPAIAPVIGGVLHEFSGWRANFWVSLLVGVVALALVASRLPETLVNRASGPLSARTILGSYGVLVKHRGYLACLGLVTLAYAGLFAFISGSSHVLQDLYGLTPVLFGFGFALCVIGYIAGTAVATRIVPRIGLDRTMGAGCLCLAAGGAGMAVAVALGIPSAFGILLPMMLYMAGVGLTLPQSLASAMTPFPERAGAASSLIGFVQMTFAALVGLWVGHGLGSSAWPLAGTVAVIGLAALALWAVSRRVRAA